MTEFTSGQLLSPSISGQASQAGGMSSTGKTRLYWVLYFITLFLFVEFSLQLFYRLTTGTYLSAREKPPIYASDPYSGWTNRSNLNYQHVTPEFSVEIDTNSEGFRVSSAREEYNKTKPQNTYRVLLLGPSFAFGWGVNYQETFGAQLQQLLTERRFAHESRIEVLNHGVAGLPAANELEWLKQVGKNYNPDLIIHFAYGSLEARSEAKTDIAVRGGVLVLTELTSKEMVAAYAKNLATVFYGGLLIGKLYALNSNKTANSLIEGAGRELRNNADFNAQEPMVRDSLTVYDALRQTAEAAGAQLLVVYFPLSYVVYPEDRARWAILGINDIEGQIKYNRAFTAHLNGLGIRTLNLTDSFLQTAKTEKRRLYYWLDLHWTEPGNTVAACSVADYLTSQCQNCAGRTS